MPNILLQATQAALKWWETEAGMVAVIGAIAGGVALILKSLHNVKKKAKAAEERADRAESTATTAKDRVDSIEEDRVTKRKLMDKRVQRIEEKVKGMTNED